MKKFFGALFFGVISPLILSGCSVSPSKSASNWVNNKTIKPSGLPSAVVQFVDRAGAKVGDPHPEIVIATTDTDEATQKPMYDLVISGSFTYDHIHTNQLPMIVLADGSAGDFTSPKYNVINKIPLFQQPSAPASQNRWSPVVGGSYFLLQGKITDFGENVHGMFLKLRIDHIIMPGPLRTPAPKFQYSVGDTVTVQFKGPFPVKPKVGNEIELGVKQYTADSRHQPFWGSTESQYYYQKNGQFYDENGHVVGIAT